MDIPVRSDDGTLPPDCALSRWCSLMLQAGQLCGRPDSVAPRCKSLMLEAGFVDVVELQFKWPTNPWPADKRMKELGMWHQVNQADGLEGATMAMFTRVLGWTQLQVQEFVVEVKKNTRDRSIHAYWPLYDDFIPSYVIVANVMSLQIRCLWTEAMNIMFSGPGSTQESTTWN